MGILFNRGNGALGAEAAGEDHVSGFIFQNSDALYAGVAQKIFTLKEFEALIGYVEATHINEWYHVNAFYAMREKITGSAQGELWVMINSITALSYDGGEVKEIQEISGGRIRKLGIFLTDPYLDDMITDTQAIVDLLEADHKPLSFILAADFTSGASGSLADARTLDSKNASICIGEDGAGRGAELATAASKSITNIGAVLGAWSAAAVHENLGWREKFDLTYVTTLGVPSSQGDRVTENETVSLGTTDTELPDTAAQVIMTTKGYIFLQKEIGFNGSFINDTPTCTLITSDYAYMERNTTMDKAVREIRTVLVPKISAPLYVSTETGKLSTGTLEDFKNEALKPLDLMATALELSVNDQGVLPVNTIVIDPDQNVLVTSKIIVGVTLVPVGVAREIQVDISFATSVS